MLRSLLVLLWLCGSITTVTAQSKGRTVALQVAGTANNRMQYGLARLGEALGRAGYTVARPAGNTIVVGLLADKAFQQKAKAMLPHFNSAKAGKEGFVIEGSNGQYVIGGADYSGALYGCLELADSIAARRALPVRIAVTDQPEMVLRGACVGIQKPYYLPGRHVYEYPYTPEVFPWLYDKKLWLQYLDSMVANRLNSLYLWNGHPFASLVKTKDYPYAVEVDEATFKKNEELYSFLTKEADRRGIWVIQMFYNIIVSKPFAEKHQIKTQDRNRPIVPLIADYTRKSIAAFVEKYPNVGLLVCLGEAMEGTGNDDTEWFTKTIIPGVQDGLKALGKTEEPPIVLRAHDTDAPAVMKAALPLYRNLYTMAKYNGEALTTYTPRGPWAELHQSLSDIGTVHIQNVHILANLEPFRYGSPDFIQKCVQAMHSVYRSNGLHIYPQSSYWDWPYSADNTKDRLLQVQRDWIWNRAWARYAWKAGRNRQQEQEYWSNLLAKQYGTHQQAGAAILKAYEETGEIAPKLLRRFGITDGNRQTLTLGMLMNQLINPFRYGLFTLLYNSEGPEGEMLTEYAEREWKGLPHVGETPVQVIQEVRQHGQRAVEAINSAAAGVGRNRDEYVRLQNDVYAYKALADFYATKAEAALAVLRYKYSNNLADLDKAKTLLRQSVAHFATLSQLTKNTYLYANSMQTAQRKIPVGGDNATMKTWVELLPVYQQELAVFEHRIDSLRTPRPVQASSKNIVLTNAPVKVLGNADWYDVRTGTQLIADTATYIKDYAAELKNLKGLRLPRLKQLTDGTTILFENSEPVKVLVGYFNTGSNRYLQAPQLETDATANDYRQAEPTIRNALLVSGLPPVNVHTFSFKPGSNTLRLGRGIALVLGFVAGDAYIPVYDTGLVSGSVKKELDWLFE